MTIKSNKFSRLFKNAVRRKGEIEIVRKKSISIVALLAVVWIISMGSVAFGEENTKAVVIDRMVNIHEAPEEHSKVATTIGVGGSVFVVGNKGRWLEVSTENGFHGWIHTKSLLVLDYAKHPIKEGIVNMDLLYVNELPDPNSMLKGTLGFTARVSVIAEEGKWFQVALGEDVIGWVLSEFITIPEKPSYPRASVQTDKAKIRAEASNNSDTICEVEKNTVIELKDYAEDYFHVVLPDGREGWIHQYQMKTVHETIEEKNKLYFSQYIKQQEEKAEKKQDNSEEDSKNTPSMSEDFEDIKKMGKLLGQDFTVTAYDLSIASCGKALGDKYRGFTSTGINLNGKQWGEAMVVSVNSKTIPLGSKVLIIFKEGDWRSKYNGIYLAGDTGSGIKAKSVDIYLGDGGNEQLEAVKKFGRASNVEIYLIE